MTILGIKKQKYDLEPCCISTKNSENISSDNLILQNKKQKETKLILTQNPKEDVVFNKKETLWKVLS